MASTLTGSGMSSPSSEPADACGSTAGGALATIGLGSTGLGLTGPMLGAVAVLAGAGDRLAAGGGGGGGRRRGLRADDRDGLRRRARPRGRGGHAERGGCVDNAVPGVGQRA